jgi:hypothetical protein
VPKETLVSTGPLRERIRRLEAEVEAQRQLRADDDPFFRWADYFLAAMTEALREAEREYVSTAEAARLTGWSEQTLRARGRDVTNGRLMPAGWEGLLARQEAHEWAFCVATIPIKGQAAA